MRHIVLTGNDQVPERITASIESLRWQDLLAGSTGRLHRVIDIDIVSILYTSGSTGRPKGVVLSHRNMVAGAHSVVELPREHAPTTGCSPCCRFSFDYGFSQLTTAFLRRRQRGAASITCCPGRDRTPSSASASPGSPRCRRSGSSSPSCRGRRRRRAPALHHQLRRRACRARRSTSCAQRCRRREPFLMYGLTEAFRWHLPAARRRSTGGRTRWARRSRMPRSWSCVPTASPCAPDEPGELVHRGALVALGYWNDPEKTAERFKPLPGQRAELPIPEMAVWSGDTVRIDEEGFLYFVGRRDEMIKTSGYRVSPTEVEEVVYATGLVGDAVAVGVPHPGAGRGDRAGGRAVAARRQRCDRRDLRCWLHCQAADAGLHGAGAHRVAATPCRAIPTASSTGQRSPRSCRSLFEAAGMTLDAFPQHAPHPYFEVAGRLPARRRPTARRSSPSASAARRSTSTTAAVMTRAGRASCARALPRGVQLHYAIKANPMPARGPAPRRAGGRPRRRLGARDAGRARHRHGSRRRSASPVPARRADELDAGRRSRHRHQPRIRARDAAHRGASAQRTRPRPKVAVRVNPGLRAQVLRHEDGRRPEAVRHRRRARAGRCCAESAGCRSSSAGFHIFSGSQNLRRRGLVEAQQKTRRAGAATRRACAGAGAPAQSRRRLRHPVFPGRAAARPRRRSARTSTRWSAAIRARAARSAQLVIELGRYLVGEAGIYVCRVIDRKVSRGQVFLVTDGGLHHHLAASGNFGQVMRKNYPVLIANRIGARAREIASVVGPLCTPLDLLADRMELARRRGRRSRRRVPVRRLRTDGQSAGLPEPPRPRRDLGLVHFELYSAW